MTANHGYPMHLPLGIPVVVKQQFSAKIGSYAFANEQPFNDCFEYVKLLVDCITTWYKGENQPSKEKIHACVHNFCKLIDDYYKIELLDKYNDTIYDLFYCTPSSKAEFSSLTPNDFLKNLSNTRFVHLMRDSNWVDFVKSFHNALEF